MRIEMITPIVRIIEDCEHLTDGTAFQACAKICPLAGACLEYWTGDDTQNQD